MIRDQTYGGMKAADVKELQELRVENARLKTLLAEAEPGQGDAQGPRGGQMVTPDRRRAAVERLQDRFGVSQRRAHRLQRPPQRRHKRQRLGDGPAEPAPVPLGLRWRVERTNSWLSNYGQLRRNTDRKPEHRLAQLALALIITLKLIDHRNRWPRLSLTRPARRGASPHDT